MVRKRIESFGYAFRGFSTLVKSQPNARFHLFATICVILAGFILDVSSVEWAILVLATGCVWTAEALNTALEFLADRVSPEWDVLVRNAKDVAAAGVLASSVAAAVVGFLIFLPHIIQK
jgi:diacylglycerol kinase (ATP)